MRGVQSSYALGVIEGPSFGSKGAGQHERAHLWWELAGLLDELCRDVIEVPPTNRAKYATGKGNAGKDEVLAAVVRRYPDVNVTNNNEADSLVLGMIPTLAPAFYAKMPAALDPITHSGIVMAAISAFGLNLYFRHFNGFGKGASAQGDHAAPRAVPSES